MKPIKLLLFVVWMALALAFAAGVAGVVADSTALKTVALVFLGVGVVVASLPLVGGSLLLLVESLRRRRS